MQEKALYVQNNTHTPIAQPSLMEGKEMPVWKVGEKYEVAVQTGRYADGRIKYKRELVDTEVQAHQRERELLGELKRLSAAITSLQEKPEPPAELFAKFASKWLRRKKFEVANKTWERYEGILEQHILPAFDKRYINDIDEEEVMDYFVYHSNSGTTLRQHHTILKSIFRLAGIDVMRNIKRPRKNNTEINCIKDPVDLALFINSMKSSILFLPTYIAAVTGMRLSEIAGLRWGDVNLKEGRITVNRSLHWGKEGGIKKWYVKSTKNGSSKRTIKISNKDIEILQKVKEVRGPKLKDFICIDAKGNPICKDSVSSNFIARAKARGYDISFHSLRHSHATILIQHYKKSINAVSKRLGHANEITTLTIYASVLPREDSEIAETMGVVMSEVCL